MDSCKFYSEDKLAPLIGMIWKVVRFVDDCINLESCNYAARYPPKKVVSMLLGARGAGIKQEGKEREFIWGRVAGQCTPGHRVTTLT